MKKRNLCYLLVVILLLALFGCESGSSMTESGSYPSYQSSVVVSKMETPEETSQAVPTNENVLEYQTGEGIEGKTLSTDTWEVTLNSAEFSLINDIKPDVELPEDSVFLLIDFTVKCIKEPEHGESYGFAFETINVNDDVPIYGFKWDDHWYGLDYIRSGIVDISPSIEYGETKSSQGYFIIKKEYLEKMSISPTLQILFCDFDLQMTKTS